MQHHTNLDQYPGGMEELAEEIGNLRYDALADFLQKLSEKIRLDAEKDEGRGRTKLSGNLYQCADSLKEAKASIDKAWVICKPFTS